MTPHPRLPGVLGDGNTLRDEPQSWPVSAREEIHSTAYLSLSIDTIVDPHGGEHGRAVVRPNGAVGILAIDDEDRILLVEQYRHPVQSRLLEIPAGTLDVDGEGPLEAAARELAEETDLTATEWQPLLSQLATPGYSTEAWQTYRASGLSPLHESERTTRVAEEADMKQWWIPFESAVTAVLEGRITDSMTVSAILAAKVLRGQ